MLPCRMAAMRPTKPRRRPFNLEGDGWLGKRDVVMRNGSENSSPEKGRRKRKCVRLSRYGALVPDCDFDFSASDFAAVPFVVGFAAGSVSGRAR